MDTITNGTDSCIFKNANWRSTYGAYTQTPSNIVDQDITIRDLYMNGQRSNNVAGGFGGVGNANSSGMFVAPIQFWGVGNLRIENCMSYDPVGYCYHVANINVGYFSNLQGISPTVVSAPTSTPSLGIDLLHVNGPAQYLTIDGIKGSISDDTVAFNAADGNVAGGTTATVFGGYGNVYLGSIQNCDVRNIHVTSGSDPFRTIVGSDALNNANIANVIDVKVSGAYGTTRCPSSILGSYGAVGPGGINDRITLEDYEIVGYVSSVRSAPGWILGGTCGNITLRNIKYGDLLSSSGNGALAHQINVGTGASIGRLEVDGYSIREDSSGPSTVAPAISISGGTVDILTIKNCEWTRNSATSTQFVSVSGGTVNRIVMSDCDFNNINNAISVSGGTVNGINTTGLSHRGANSNPSIAIGTSVTVARMRSSGSDTAQLQAGAGTVTSKKTDATEDS
jgi:hypothetical protein